MLFQVYILHETVKTFLMLDQFYKVLDKTSLLNALNNLKVFAQFIAEIK